MSPFPLRTIPTLSPRPRPYLLHSSRSLPNRRTPANRRRYLRSPRLLRKRASPRSRKWPNGIGGAATLPFVLSPGFVRGFLLERHRRFRAAPGEPALVSPGLSSRFLSGPRSPAARRRRSEAVTKLSLESEHNKRMSKRKTNSQTLADFPLTILSHQKCDRFCNGLSRPHWVGISPNSPSQLRSHSSIH